MKILTVIIKYETDRTACARAHGVCFLKEKKNEFLNFSKT